MSNNKIEEDQVPEILARSNIDEMAQEAQVQANASKSEGEKTIKLASIAVMMKTLPDLKKEKNTFKHGSG